MVNYGLTVPCSATEWRAPSQEQNTAPVAGRRACVAERDKADPVIRECITGRFLVTFFPISLPKTSVNKLRFKKKIQIRKIQYVLKLYLKNNYNIYLVI